MEISNQLLIVCLDVAGHCTSLISFLSAWRPLVLAGSESALTPFRQASSSRRLQKTPDWAGYAMPCAGGFVVNLMGFVHIGHTNTFQEPKKCCHSCCGPGKSGEKKQWIINYLLNQKHILRAKRLNKQNYCKKMHLLFEHNVLNSNSQSHFWSPTQVTCMVGKGFLIWGIFFLAWSRWNCEKWKLWTVKKECSFTGERGGHNSRCNNNVQQVQ